MFQIQIAQYRLQKCSRYKNYHKLWCNTVKICKIYKIYSFLGKIRKFEQFQKLEEP